MRSVAMICVLGLMSCLLIPGCKTGEKASAADGGSYTCPMCKDKVVWSYNAKGLPQSGKKIEHSCPMCKMAWTANASDKNACAECAKKEMACPVCSAKKAGG